MYPKNLAIVFGPTLVRREVTDMEHIMSDMGNQCNIVELLLVHVSCCSSYVICCTDVWDVCSAIGFLVWASKMTGSFVHSW